jgi:hypothetical protein
MSCFVVSQNHISTILSFYKKCTNRSDADLTAAGQILLDANIHAYNVRYRKTGGKEKYTFKLKHDVPALVCIKLSQCLEYNSDEDDDYSKSAAYRMINEIISSAITRLPGYDEACAWAIA